MEWISTSFQTLTNDQLYDLLKLRSDVFVVEQDCVYPDLDDLDKHAAVQHVFALEAGAILAYCRLLPPDLVYPNKSAIGRVVVAHAARDKKLGRQLMNEALNQLDRLWPDHDCKISAQEYLLNFYQSLGFEQISEMYLEDGIPHIAMLRKAKSAN